MHIIFDQANKMARDSFSDKNLEMSLAQDVCSGDFTVDVLVDPSCGEVVACVEYIYMRRYVWIECLAVKKTYQHTGLGKILMDRIKYVAKDRRKDILLYSLLDVIEFYSAFGFYLLSSYKPDPEHIGRFMVCDAR